MTDQKREIVMLVPVALALVLATCRGSGKTPRSPTIAVPLAVVGSGQHSLNAGFAMPLDTQIWTKSS